MVRRRVAAEIFGGSMLRRRVPVAKKNFRILACLGSFGEHPSRSSGRSCAEKAKKKQSSSGVSVSDISATQQLFGCRAMIGSWRHIRGVAAGLVKTSNAECNVDIQVEEGTRSPKI